jgi:hypothetical protein
VGKVKIRNAELEIYRVEVVNSNVQTMPTRSLIPSSAYKVFETHKF